MDDVELNVNQLTSSFLRKASKIKDVPLFVRAHLSKKASELIKEESERRQYDICARCGLKLNVENVGIRIRSKISRNVCRKKLIVNCIGCQFHICKLELPKHTEKSAPSSLIEMKTPSSKMLSTCSATPLTSLNNTPLKASTNRKRDKVNKLQRLAALQQAGIEKVSEPRSSLSLFLNSLKK